MRMARFIAYGYDIQISAFVEYLYPTNLRKGGRSGELLAMYAIKKNKVTTKREVVMK